MTHEDSLKLKKEELTGALNKLTEELHEVEERVKTLTAERDQYKEAHSVAEAEVGKLEAEKEEARVAFKAINDQYIAANEEFEKTRNHLLQLIKQTKELHEVQERVKTLTAESDQYKEAHSVAEAEVGKLEAKKEEARTCSIQGDQ
ncbi:hypothetical protein POM88_034721 [Heracleum sosnowskyi]|uniref:Uncharacterized protein n=1 Tax=Heracleum sosnowskyi TaxID=360622 RepID=A0AAD8MDF6_9APIA|nr:hypothetical protein POM88_034721 [Heracleum sosnowskyi]